MPTKGAERGRVRLAMMLGGMATLSVLVSIPVHLWLGAPFRAIAAAMAGSAFLLSVVAMWRGASLPGRVLLFVAAMSWVTYLSFSDPSSSVWLCYLPIAGAGIILFGPYHRWMGLGLTAACAILLAAGAGQLAALNPVPPLDDPIPPWMNASLIAAGLGGWLYLQYCAVKQGADQLIREHEARLQLEKEAERRQALLDELAQVTAKAEAANEAKSAFLANMTHEIRTPLSAVIGLLDIALGRYQDQELQLARRSADHLLNILSDILDLSKIEKGELTVEAKPTNVEELVRDAVELARVRAEAKGLEVHLEVDWDQRPVRLADALRLKQVLHNLLMNAVSFTETGEIRVKVHAQGDDVRFEIRDTGRGMSRDQLRKVLQAFHQTENASTRSVGGIGLGLSIVNGVLSAYGARLQLKSRLWVGTAARFSLKLPSARLSLGPALTLPPTRIHAGAMRILVVEDNPLNQMIARKQLEARGHDVAVANHGQEAVEMAFEGWDVILMDVQMPVLDGRDATRQIRAAEVRREGEAVPIVALTANAMHGDREACIEAGMDGFLPKPLDLQALDRVLLRLAARQAA